MKGEFDKKIERFSGMLDLLQKSSPYSRDQLQNVPDKGIYVFYDENNLPLYVGRSDRIRKRLLAHSRPSSGHESATFAFILAKEKLKDPTIADTMSRSRLQLMEEFSTKFDRAKVDVSKMRVRVIEIIDPTEQALFEIYASLELNTPYNFWENH